MVSLHSPFWQRLVEEGLASVLAGLGGEEAIALAESYGTPNYHPLPVVLAHGEGGMAYDPTGKDYLDCVGAYSALSHGHLNPALVRVAKEQLDRLTLASRAFYTRELGLFCKGLAEYCELEMVCPMNTGAEANETAIKIARKWAYEVKGVPADRAEIIVCEGNFHGRTTTIVGFSSEESYRRGFGPFTPGFVTIPFGDVDALERAIGPHTAAFLAEPIQAEAGVIVPPDGWMAAVRTVCTEHDVLLVWDEVQTGFCRTGRNFCWMHEDARPDVIALGKALGGGILPVAAAVGRRDVMRVLGPGTHGSTFGGNPLACAVGLAAMAEMEVHDYAGRAERLGSRLRAGLAASGAPGLADIRGRGLLLGVEFEDGVDTEALAHQFLAHGLLTKETRHRTFRFAPPLTVDEAFIDEVVDRFARAVRAALA